jgi:alpha-tubulin suppressor-like RCC1 family protein
VEALQGKEVVAVAAGNEHTVVLTEGGLVCTRWEAL